ncbi:hypothetical protein LTR66_004480 [Elasticomyces elasticus]|nr:hypothetical protein LTR66_004480 [Elasticomyces elasticus]KAK5009094.1 hypothetical protein LTR28_002748 [Elasticomyces elasticus]
MGSLSQQPHVPAAGVWCPAVTFFDQTTDTLDLISQKAYYTYLSRSGLTGLVILGTNAETFLLTREERAALLRTARDAVGPEYPLMAGVGGHSTKQVLEFIGDAVEAKADYALVLPPAYFGKAMTSKVIENFYEEVAEESKLPIVIYNFPGVCNGVDLDSDIVTGIAKTNRNVVGVKLTCASVGKITRLAATFGADEFAIFGGQSDSLIGGLSVGLWKDGKLDEALKLHQKAALAESPCKAGIASTKYAAAIYSATAAGIVDAEENLKPRRLYEPPTDAIKQSIREAMGEVAKVEASL